LIFFSHSIADAFAGAGRPPLESIHALIFFCVQPLPNCPAKVENQPGRLWRRLTNVRDSVYKPASGRNSHQDCKQGD
jgi:hypothetical protein